MSGIPPEYTSDLAYVRSQSQNGTLTSSNQTLQRLQTAAGKGIKPLAEALAQLKIK